MGNKTKKMVGALVSRAGVSFRVWAPFADSVSVMGSFSDWREVPLVSENDGYWAGFVKGAVAGQEYKFQIQAGEQKLVRNDPRALHLTTTAGTSVIAGNNFEWGSDSFVAPPLEEQVIYELHVGTFNRPDPAVNGTFNDVIAKLDYLKELGINMIELMPINSMLMDRGWGYAIDYIFAVESLYGGRHAFMQFVKEAHSRGVGVILDVVYNHFGPDSNMDLWLFDGWQENNKGGIYFYNDWRAETPWGNTRPDFGRPEVRQYITDNVSMWVHDCHVDGLRVDSTIYIRNVKGLNNDPAHDLPEGWLLLQQLNTIARKINPEVLTIAEDIAGNDYIVKPVKEGGAGFSAQWELGFPSILKKVLSTNEPSKLDISGLCEELSRTYNNDAFQRIVFSDSHDSAANGSARLVEVISGGKANNLFARNQALIAAALILTAPGIPMLFQGEEFVQGGVFSDWKGLDWSLAARFQGITDAYRHLIALRQNRYGTTAGLTGRNIKFLQTDEANKVIAFHRWRDGGPRDDVVVIVNFGSQLHTDYTLDFPHAGKWDVRFNSTWKGYSADFRNINCPSLEVQNGKGGAVVPPASVLILSQE